MAQSATKMDPERKGVFNSSSSQDSPQKPPLRNGAGGRVLVVAEDRELLRMAQPVLTEAGFDCDVFDNGENALWALKQRGAEVVVTALRAGGMGGLELLRKARAFKPELPVIVLATEPTVGSAVAAMRDGAFDYLSKPFDQEELKAIVTRAVEIGSLRTENRRLRQQLDVASAAAGFVAESLHSKQLLAMIRRVAPARSTALIEGESGTGKELVARLLHYWSRRADGPFVAINCKAFADGVVESELFGHEKGSFTGAIASRPGCFERASGGTLFLDEIAEAGPDFQAKLLRVLEDGEVLRVGATKPRRVDVRILAATNRTLLAEVATKRFRADLFFRLNVIPIRIRPLRERPEDILPLARHFLAFHSAEAGRPLSLTPEAEHVLCSYPWSGNVRELENVIERAVVLSGAEQLDAEAFALEAVPSEHEPEGEFLASEGGGQETLQEALDRTAAARIRAGLAEAKGNRGQAAVALGVDRTTLYRLMKRLGI